MTDEDRYAQAFVGARDEPVPIPWTEVDPACLPDGSLVRAAIEDGRPDVAEWIAAQFPTGGRAYVHSETSHRSFVFRSAARRAVSRGMSVREAARRFGLDRGALSP